MMTDAELMEMSRAYRWVEGNGGLDRVRRAYRDGVGSGGTVHAIAGSGTGSGAAGCGFRDPSYYTDHAVETCIKQDLIADHLERAGVPARHIKDASTAVKYIDRLGEKDSIEADSFKAANYLYRFMTGSFIGREVDDADER